MFLLTLHFIRPNFAYLKIYFFNISYPLWPPSSTQSDHTDLYPNQEKQDDGERHLEWQKMIFFAV